MKAKYQLIDVDGEKYPITYNMVVSRELQEEFGTLSDWGRIFETVERDEAGNIIEDTVNGIPISQDGEFVKNADGSTFLAKQKEPRISDMVRTFKIMINEGIRQYNKENVDKMSKLDTDDITDLLGYINGSDLVREMVAKANPEQKEDNSKNVQTEQNQ